MVEAIPTNTKGLRDRAMLLLGFAFGARRSELTALLVEDLQFDDNGLRVLIRKSKGDQAGEGQYVGVAYGSNRATCPVRSLQAWLAAMCNPSSGPLFRRITQRGVILDAPLRPRHFARLVKQYADKAGLDASKVSAHSVRSGFCVSSYLRGAHPESIMRSTRHKNAETLRRYLKVRDLFIDNASAKLGL
jgi:integrase